MRLIHLTDPHLSSLDGRSFWNVRGKRRSGYLSWHRKRRHVHRREVLERLTDSINAQKPDLILLTGDLVHIGLDHEMAEAASWLKQLGPPENVVFVPGNHDNYARDSLEAMYSHWNDYLPGTWQPDMNYTTGYPLVRELGNIKLAGVNSSCITPVFSARGELGTEQRQRLTRELEPKTGENPFRCLLIHHPPFPGMTRRRKALRDDRELQELLTKQPVELLLHGHVHRNREDRLNGVRSYCTASASSVRSASYRIFDLEQEDPAWRCRMRLMSISGATESEPVFKLAGETSWQV
ncbi:MAG: metallophosphoesterase [Xanthomonadales bacterium]|nr:metallophosphoesterase [Gammaproteobacteria bacterium]MBT8052682.1 metallophosphoesterase [Gammaproteobacteria bacterium]NND56797.1 metallophosphoesterase [Xanthomonadales bacterium]NNK50660.1 metallophosphoesterase [Xanthomonadales bacterium]